MRKEFKWILFYVVYVIAILIGDKMAPSGPCTPGLGFFLFLLLIPISIILLLKDIYKYYREPGKSRLYSILIHPLIWSLLFLCLHFKIF
ncbi:MAG: hypothetical protein RLZZ469_665 [Bacteroidota bacterium]